MASKCTVCWVKVQEATNEYVSLRSPHGLLTVGKGVSVPPTAARPLAHKFFEYDVD